MAKKYDIVLIAKGLEGAGYGLATKDCVALMNKLDAPLGYPFSVAGTGTGDKDLSVIGFGFMTQEAFEAIGGRFEDGSDFEAFLSVLLNDTVMYSDNTDYNFRGLSMFIAKEEKDEEPFS